MTEAPRFCENCGAPLEPDARFCDECGQPVAEAPGPQAPPPAVPPVQAQAPGAPPPRPASGMDSRLMFGGALVAGGALAGLVVLLFFLFSGDDGTPTATTGTPTAETPTVATAAPTATTGAPPATEAPNPTTEEPGTAPPGWRVVLQDTFDSNVNGWPTGEYADDSVAQRNRDLAAGAYSLSVVTEQGWLAPELLEVDVGSDFHLAVDAMRLAGGPEAVCGLMFAGAGGNSRAALLVSDLDGGFRVYRADAERNESESLVELTPSAAILSGSANRLAVLVEGSSLVLFVNGERVGEVGDARVGSVAQVGLVVGTWDSSGTATCEFDNFEVRTP